MKETEKQINEDIPCPRIDRINFVKTATLPKAIYRFNAIAIKIPTEFFTQKNWTDNPKICIEPLKMLNSQSTLEKEKQSWKHHTPWSKLYHKAIIIKQHSIGIKYRYTVQWNKTESPEKKNLHIYGQFIHKSEENTQRGKDSLFNKWHLKNWIATYKRMKWDSYLTPHTKTNSKCIEDLRKVWNHKTLEENMGVRTLRCVYTHTLLTISKAMLTTNVWNEKKH